MEKFFADHVDLVIVWTECIFWIDQLAPRQTF